ncbi:MAG: cytochrome c [Chloroflexi bacterium]|nr:cytochrome c [Chloroflexota bacterium]
MKNIARLLLLLGIGLVLAACMGFAFRGQGPAYGDRSRSNGERIYYTGTSANGPIGYRGGVFGGMMGGGGMMTGRLACADCHGADARGGRHFMMMTVMDAPDIRWSTLTGEDHGEPAGGEGEHEENEMEHPPYDAESFKLAVTRGVNPAGEPLDAAMPRWRMSDEDIQDLIEFLQSVP